jgi:thiamine transport system permease protein
VTTLPRRPGRRAAGALVALAIALLVLLLFRAIVAAAAGQGTALSPATVDLGHLLRMTAIQAGLSTVLSLIVGVALAWALNRLRFPGRGLIIGLFASAIVTPA